MAKPSWLTVTPASGSGNGSVSVSATEHTGRSQRSGSLTFKASGVTDVTVPVTQAAKPEFITLNNVSAPKGGGNVTISGRSNADTITFTLGAGDIIVTLPSNYTAAGKTTNNGTAIAGDPGASAQFDFSIVISVPANGTVSQKTRIVTATTKTGGETASATITQAAGDPVLTVTPTSINLTVTGTAVSATVTSNTNWTVE